MLFALYVNEQTMWIQTELFFKLSNNMIKTLS